MTLENPVFKDDMETSDMTDFAGSFTFSSLNEMEFLL